MRILKPIEKSPTILRCRKTVVSGVPGVRLNLLNFDVLSKSYILGTREAKIVTY